MDITIIKLILLIQIFAKGALCQSIIVNPANATVKEGDNVILRCEFDKPVKECFWSRRLNNFWLELSMTDWRYQYSDATAKGRNTSNCSLKIKGVQYMEDAYYWRCSNARGSGLKSNEAYLSVVHAAITVSPQNATVVEGDSIALQCEFDAPIKECGWSQNGNMVTIDRSYQYSDATANGRNTRNCSLLINTFRKIDAAYWQCHEVYSGRRLGTSSKRAHLTLVLSITVYPKNTTVLEGTDIILQCKFNKGIDRCVWFSNGNIVEITDRYRYYNSDVNGTTTNDCSIEITQFSKTDATSWQCFSAVNCDIKKETCMSNPAYLGIIHPASKTLKRCGFVSFLWNDDARTILIIVLSSALVITIASFIIYCLRMKKGKEDAELHGQSTTNGRSQVRGSQEFHEYMYITTQKDASEEDAIGYLLPKGINRPYSISPSKMYEDIH